MFEIVFVAVAPFACMIVGLLIAVAAACDKEQKAGPEVDLTVHVDNSSSKVMYSEPRDPRSVRPSAPFTEKDLPGGFLASEGLAQGLFDCFIPTGDTP